MSYENEKKNIKGEYPYPDIRIRIFNNDRETSHNRRTRMRFEVYIPVVYSHILEKAKKIARREGRSLSALILDLLRDYVRVHEPGNPQLPIDRFLKDHPSREDNPPQSRRIDPLEDTRRWFRRLIKTLEAGRQLPYDHKVLAEAVAGNPGVKDLPEARRLLELLGE